MIDQAFQLTKAFAAKIGLVHIAAPNPDFVGYEAGPNISGIAEPPNLKKCRLLQEYRIKLKENRVNMEGLPIPGATIEMVIAESIKLKLIGLLPGTRNIAFFTKPL